MKNKKLNLLYLAATIATIILSYLLVAFCTWDANPSNWGFAGRYVSCIIWVIISSISIFIINLTYDTF